MFLELVGLVLTIDNFWKYQIYLEFQVFIFSDKIWHVN